MFDRAALTQAVSAALAQFDSASRLYALTVGEGRSDLGASGLLVEAFAADDAVQGMGGRDVIAVSTSAYLDLESLLGQPATLDISLANRSREQFSGDISEVAMLGSEGGLARYRIRISPWVWRLGQVRNSRVWQDKTVLDIVDEVFAGYQPLARWRWSDETAWAMGHALPRSYCVQYRETDLAFVQRLLAEEGLCWRFEQGADGPAMVLFADSTRDSAIPLDPGSEAGGGIRFHGARSGEQHDTVQALQAQRKVNVMLTSVLSYDYKSKQAVSIGVPSNISGGRRLPMLESFDAPGQYAYADSSQAQRYATFQMQAREARAQLWRGRSTVRTLRAGTRIDLTNGPLQQDDLVPSYTILRVASVGVNNLPAPAQHALAELFGPIPELLEETLRSVPADFALALAEARKSGYANCFEAVASDVVWRPQYDSEDPRHHPRPTASGAQSAIVIGEDGSDQPRGADELYCDKLGRVRIRFHWQDGNASCWVRVAQRAAGGGMGSQFLPRIGQEVLVQFLENDIDRPLIIGALYNGQGEGGIAPTPGGEPDAGSAANPFGPANDYAPSAQGNLAGGNSPLWHGASADSAGHRNSASQWGVRSKEFGGSGYNQLLFDDTDSQGRVQLRSTHAASELNLGHLVHGADNFRGSLRGRGAELRTDAYGVVRAKGGLLVTSYKVVHSAAAREPAGDNAPGIAMLKQAVKLGETFSDIAATHKTVTLGAHLGAAKANASLTNPEQAPLKTLLTAVSGMVSDDSIKSARGDAKARNTAPGEGKLPHTADAIIAIAAQSGLGVNARHSLHLSNGETVALMSGQDTQFIGGGELRMHSGQAIGMLGGVVKPGEEGIGMQFIAAKGAIDIQAQAGTLVVQARDGVKLASAKAHVDWAAATSISLSTAAGANITIAGGNITVQCPGTIHINAGTKNFLPPEQLNYPLPVMPVSEVTLSLGRTLSSTYAYDQLVKIAKHFTKLEFVTMLVPIFGFDIPAHTYIKLYQGLRDGSIGQPKLVLQDGGHFPASFDNESRTIFIHQAAADRAAKGQDDSWLLLTALLHEFGHYIDVVLRTDLADKNPDGSSTLALDSEDDEGAKYAYHIAFIDFADTSETTYANYTSPKFSGALKVKYNEARKAIQRAQAAEAQRMEGKNGEYEYFGAGLGEHHKDRPTRSFGHQSIEYALVSASKHFESEAVLRQIYFGNWLRDFSQLLDPALVRAPGDPKNFPKVIGRQELTELVDLLAEVEFVRSAEDKPFFKVTKELLGVYRPVEHIDNPTNNKPGRDPQTIDKDFQPRATKKDVAVDAATSMKHYIGASREYMKGQLDIAAAASPGRVAYRHFGAALHVLEDYFAHSNFVELSLRKLGHTKVLPWTSPTVGGKHPLPIVTGMFDSDDVIASTAGMLADAMFKVEFKYEESKPGHYTMAEKITRIMLREHSDPDMAKGFEAYLKWRDEWRKNKAHKYVEGAMHYTLGMQGNATNFVVSSLIHLGGNSVDDQQVVRLGDPNKNGSTDPTHSQLAKDHDNHPFHTLAANLAKQAVEQVGIAMAASWWGGAEAKKAADPAKIAASYLVHPYDTNWQDEYVKAWAAKNMKQVIRGESATEWEAIDKAHRQEAIDASKAADKKSRQIFKYVNDFYEDLMGDKNQVLKKR